MPGIESPFGFRMQSACNCDITECDKCTQRTNPLRNLALTRCQSITQSVSTHPRLYLERRVQDFRFEDFACPGW